MAGGGQQASRADARFCSEWDTAAVSKRRSVTGLPGHGGGLCVVGPAGGGGEEPMAASPEFAAAAEVTAGGGAVDQCRGRG